MATHKPFRELVKPGSNFEFVGRTRTWVLISVVLIAASIGMLFVNKAVRGDYLNWTIDFKGGTELVFEFRGEDEQLITISPGAAREALNNAGMSGFDVSDFTWEVFEDGQPKTAHGLLIRTPEYGALEDARAEAVLDAFLEKFTGRDILSAQWSGDRLFVRSKQAFDEAAVKEFFSSQDLEMKDWGEQGERFRTAEAGTDEYTAQFAIRGIDRQFERILEEATGVDATVIQAYGVGAKAGDRLRNDGIKALFYSVALILLYLAFRFDIRYAPGAVIALLHDSILVVGVFAVTWMDVSLTSVAALLTVIGYSVNDTVIIFDRIRENVGRLTDKRLPRVVNISLNETLSRTLLTSLTLFVVTLMMNIFGTGLVRNFAFAMNVGVVVGVYSSIFVASPFLLWADARFYPGGRGKA